MINIFGNCLIFNYYSVFVDFIPFDLLFQELFIQVDSFSDYFEKCSIVKFS